MARKVCSDCNKAQAVRPGGLCNKCYSARLTPAAAQTEKVPLAKIRMDGGTQARVVINESTVDDYAEAAREGQALPPPVVFFDGSSYWMGDGFHRVLAYSRLEFAEVECVVKKGTRRDAVLYAVGANANHGLRRTAEDKRNAVVILLSDEEWSQRPTGWIARTANVCWDLADKIRQELGLKPEKITRSNGTTQVATISGRGPRPDADSGPEDQAEEASPPAREVKLEPEPATEAAPEKPPVTMADRTGREIPGSLRDVFEWDEDFKLTLDALRKLKGDVSAMCGSPAGRQISKERQGIDTAINNIRRAVRFSRPYAVCPYCKAGGQSCRACADERGRPQGWVTESVFNQAPVELRGDVLIEEEDDE